MITMEMMTLNSKNFLDYALQNYNNPECKDIEEFSEDVNRIKYLKRLFSRYEQENDFKCRLVTNHLIVFNNVFGLVPSCRILFFRVDPRYHSILKTCLFHLDMLAREIPEIEINKVPLDTKILTLLEVQL